MLELVAAPWKFDLLMGGVLVGRRVRSSGVWVARVVLGCPRSRWPRRRAGREPRSGDPRVAAERGVSLSALAPEGIRSLGPASQ